MPDVTVRQNVTSEQRKKAHPAGPRDSVLPGKGWTCHYNKSLLSEVSEQQTADVPRLSAGMEIWPAQHRELGARGLSAAEEKGRAGFSRNPMSAEEVEIWQSEQVSEHE